MNISYDRILFLGEWNFIWASDFMKSLARSVKWNLILNDAPALTTMELTENGLQPILEQLHCGQWELCRKRHRSVDSTLTLKPDVNGP